MSIRQTMTGCGPLERLLRNALERDLHRTPRGFFPPEMIFAPASAYILERAGMSYCLIGGEHFGDNRWAKGQVYYVGNHDYSMGLKLLVRANEISIYEPSKSGAYALKEEIKDYARANRIERVIVGCDLGHFTGLYHKEGRNGLSLHDGIARLCCLADEMHADPELHFVNCGAIADSYWHPRKIYDLYMEMGIGDAHHFTSTWMNSPGNLDSLKPDKLWKFACFVMWHTNALRNGWEGNFLQSVKEETFWEMGAEHLMEW